MHVVRADQRAITSVRQRRDHQPRCVSNVLVCVVYSRICNADQNIVFPIVSKFANKKSLLQQDTSRSMSSDDVTPPQLTKPFEIRVTRHVIVSELVDHISAVNI